MKLKDYLDIDKLWHYVEEGIVERKQHATLPLEILCYSRRATYENIWDDITTKTRGLIVDHDGNIVARSFEKFFNYETEDRPETWPHFFPVTEPIWLDKLDGSLGILYTVPGGVSDPASTVSGIATKGSFQSEQAIWATLWYHKNVINPIWPEGFTPIFEIIAQSIQTHVVLYDIPDQLILLALINNETGEEADYNTAYHYAKLNGLAIAEIYHFPDGVLEAAYNYDRPNKEGYVASWPRPGQPPLKVKFKHPTFLKLQKIVHAATPKKILEALVNKDYDTLQAWEDGLSFELAEYVRGWRDKFTGAYGYHLVRAKNVFQPLAVSAENRKEFAEWLLKQDTRYSALVFAMLDGQAPEMLGNMENVARAAWKLVTEDFKDDLLKEREE